MPDAIYRMGRACLASMLAECGAVPDGEELSRWIHVVRTPILAEPPRSEHDPDFAEVERLVPSPRFRGEALLELGPGYRRCYGWRASRAVIPRFLGLSRRSVLHHEPQVHVTGEPPPGGALHPNARWVRLRVARALRALLAQRRDWTALYLPRASGTAPMRIPGERDGGARIELDAEEIEAPSEPRSVVAPPGERGAA